MIPTFESICDTLKVHQDDVLNVFPYGSRVYGTHSARSDFDFIVVTKENVVPELQNALSKNINVTIYEKESFMEAVAAHQVSALESIYLPHSSILANKATYHFVLDKKLLRESISAKTSNSWVKAKKKFEVVQDRDVYIAKKSLFHCLRIIDFGIQIAEHNKIIDYSSANAIWRDIESDPADTWEPYRERYQAFYNEQMTRFRKLAPK